MNYRETFKQGEESAKIKSRKQAIMTGVLEAIVISVAIFNDFHVVWKLTIFIILHLTLSAVMSSAWMQKRFEYNQKGNRQYSSNKDQLQSNLPNPRTDPEGYREASMAEFLKNRRLNRQNQTRTSSSNQ